MDKKGSITSDKKSVPIAMGICPNQRPAPPVSAFLMSIIQKISLIEILPQRTKGRKVTLRKIYLGFCVIRIPQRTKSPPTQKVISDPLA